MRSKLIAPLAVALLGVAGCGSSKSSSSTTASPAKSTASSPATTPPAPAPGAAKPKGKHAKVPSRTYNVKLTGKAETPAGAPKGAGKAVITLRGKSLQVCWTFKSLKGFAGPTFAHLHSGPKGTSGNVVVPLSTGPTFQSKGCATAPATLMKAIAKNPKGFYVNIHSKKYAGGAVRAQL